jgi:hypothetical protein
MQGKLSWGAVWGLFMPAPTLVCDCGHTEDDHNWIDEKCNASGCDCECLSCEDAT